MPRRYSLNTKLGRLMASRGLYAYHVAAAANINPKLLGDFLARRRKPNETHIAYLCHALGCRPEDIIEDDDGHGAT